MTGKTKAKKGVEYVVLTDGHRTDQFKSLFPLNREQRNRYAHAYAKQYGISQNGVQVYERAHIAIEGME